MSQNKLLSPSVEELKKKLVAANNYSALNSTAKTQLGSYMSGLELQKAANAAGIEANAKNLMSQIDTQKKREYATLQRDSQNAYAGYMNSSKNLNAFLAGKGLSGGASETAALALQNSYNAAKASLKSAFNTNIGKLESDLNSVTANKNKSLSDLNAEYLKQKSSAVSDYYDKVYQNKQSSMDKTAEIEQLAYDLQYKTHRDNTADLQWKKEQDRSAYEYDTSLGYKKARDAVSDLQWKKEQDRSAYEYDTSLGYKKARDAVSDLQWKDENDRSNYEFDTTLAANKEKEERSTANKAAEYALKLQKEIREEKKDGITSQDNTFSSTLLKYLQYDATYGTQSTDAFLARANRDIEGNVLSNYRLGKKDFVITNDVTVKDGIRLIKIGNRHYTDEEFNALFNEKKAFRKFDVKNGRVTYKLTV